MKAWIAKDTSDTINVFLSKPFKAGSYWTTKSNWQHRQDTILAEILPKGIDPQWEDKKPIEVEIEIKLKKKK